MQVFVENKTFGTKIINLWVFDHVAIIFVTSVAVVILSPTAI